MADHTSNTEETPEPTVETSSAPAPEGTGNPVLADITGTILDSFTAHDNRLRAAGKRPPRVARRIRRIILRGGHAHRAADEPWRLIVAVNRLPVEAEAWRTGVMATLTERLGVPVHITLMKAQWLLHRHPALRPFHAALDASHELLYAAGDAPATATAAAETAEAVPGGEPEAPETPETPEADDPPAQQRWGDKDRLAPKDEEADRDKGTNRDKEAVPRPMHTLEDTQEDGPKDTPGKTAVPDRRDGGDKKAPKPRVRWWDAPDMGGYKAAHDREKGLLEDKDVLMEMEEPIVRLNDAAVLLTDLAYGGMLDVPPRARGLDFIAQALTRDARLLYRLYNGSPPEYN